MSLAMTPRPIPPALRPPPNTPLTPTDHSDKEADEEEEEEEPNTLSSYGLLTPSETYSLTIPHSPPSPLTSSPKRHPHATLRLRPPILRPPLPSQRKATGYAGYGGWNRPRIVIGGSTSLPSSPVPIAQIPISKTKAKAKVKIWTYPGYLGSPRSPSPSSPTSPSPTVSPPPSQTSTSPTPLPIRLRPIPLTQHMSLSASNALLPAHLRLRPLYVGVCVDEGGVSNSDSGSETEVEVDDKHEEEDASDTCASDSDSDSDSDSGVGDHSHMDRKMGVRPITSNFQISARTTIATNLR